jgi:hypothetical protein
MFDGTLGKRTGDPYHIELKPNVTPYHARAFPIPRIHEQTLRDEVTKGSCLLNDVVYKL